MYTEELSESYFLSDEFQTSMNYGGRNHYDTIQELIAAEGLYDYKVGSEGRYVRKLNVAEPVGGTVLQECYIEPAEAPYYTGYNVVYGGLITEKSFKRSVQEIAYKMGIDVSDNDLNSPFWRDKLLTIAQDAELIPTGEVTEYDLDNLRIPSGWSFAENMIREMFPKSVADKLWNSLYNRVIRDLNIEDPDRQFMNPVQAMPGTTIQIYPYNTLSDEIAQRAFAYSMAELQRQINNDYTAGDLHPTDVTYLYGMGIKIMQRVPEIVEDFDYFRIRAIESGYYSHIAAVVVDCFRGLNYQFEVSTSGTGLKLTQNGNIKHRRYSISFIEDGNYNPIDINQITLEYDDELNTIEFYNYVYSASSYAHGVAGLDSAGFNSNYELININPWKLPTTKTHWPDDEPDDPIQPEDINIRIKPIVTPVPYPVIKLLPYPKVVPSVPDIKIVKLPTPDPIIPPIPVPPKPTKAGGLYTVYNPSDAELASLGGELWDETLLDRLAKFLGNNPMNGIISLHQVFIEPQQAGASPGSSVPIVLGTEVMTTEAQLVPERYYRMNLGIITVNREFNDYRDFNTQLVIFLPFVGFKELDINDFFTALDNKGKISLFLSIDFYTGNIVYEIYALRNDSATGILCYTFEGNCSIQIPLTAADRSRETAAIISGGASVGAAIATIATKGAALPALIASAGGTAASLSGYGVQINKSGNLTGSFGAMLPRIPFLIIKRPTAYDAADYDKFHGDPANATVYLGQLSGYVRVSDVHLDGIVCTDEERIMIDNMLRQGVIL